MLADVICPRAIRLSALVTFAGLSVAYLMCKQKKEVDNTENESEKEQLIEEGDLQEGTTDCDKAIKEAGVSKFAPTNPTGTNIEGNMLGSLSLRTANDEELTEFKQTVANCGDIGNGTPDILNSLCDRIKKNDADESFSISIAEGRTLVGFLKDEDESVVNRSLFIIQAAACSEENRTRLYSCGILKALNSLIDKLAGSTAIPPSLVYCIGSLAASDGLHDKMLVYLPKLVSLMKLKEKDAQLTLAMLTAFVNFTRIVNDSETAIYKELIPELFKCARCEGDLAQQSFAFATIHNLSKVPELAKALGEHS